MSSYTMQLKTYIEMWSQEQEISTKDRIEIGRTKLFDFEYPIFDETYKKVFETHFIRHFYTREIGFETEGLFKFQLETWLLIHMPYFNKLFESELLEYDPLTNASMDVTSTKTNDKLTTDVRTTSGTNSVDSTKDTTNDGTLTEDNFTRHINSETPDERLNITANDGEGVIEYASEIDENNTNNTSTSSTTAKDIVSSDSSTNVSDTLNGDINETEDYVQKRVGKIGVQSYAKLVQDYRSALLRVENQIFKEMQELFMLVY